MTKLAQERGFRQPFLNFADIGGRYSALSYFGLVPAALLGVDVAELLIRALRMAHASASCVPVRENAGVLPVAGEPIGNPSVYGQDRLFVYVRLKNESDEALEHSVAALQKAGHLMVTIQMDDRLDLAQEFFRWEIATATAGSILGINAFDQPNVQESKDNTNRMLDEVRRTGKLPEPAPALNERGLRFYSDGQAKSALDLLKGFFAQARLGNYVALQAYLTEAPDTELALQSLRRQLRDGLRLATTLGYGPRFLHSTGQYHKGGPNTGLFLQLTADDGADIPVPGQPYTFGTFKRAQALGDLEALRKHGRRVMRIHLGADVGQGLAAVEQIVQAALTGGKA